MMKVLRVFVLSFLLLPACTAAPAPPALTPTDDLAEIEGQILELVNRERQARRLAPLAEVPALADLARDHSRAMARGLRPFGHHDFRARAERVRALVPASGPVSENVASNVRHRADAAPHVVRQWLQSDGHRQTMLERGHVATGIGVARADNGEVFYTQIFVARSAAVAAR